MHGPMSCPQTANGELGNWLRLRYDRPHEGTLVVRASRKPIVNWNSATIMPSEHDRACRYRRDDASGKIQDWSQFI